MQRNKKAVAKRRKSMKNTQRGYNQAELLAGEVAWATGLPAEGEALVRRGRAQPQARQAGEDSRQANVASAFAAGTAQPPAACCCWMTC